MSKTYEVSELGDMLIYQNEKGDTKVDVYFFDKDIWMSQAAIAQMYNTTPQNITMHIKNIYEDGELDEESTCKEFLQVQTEGTRQIKRNKKHYNFRMILAIGYRVRSNVGIHFRNWASGILEEYTRKGFAMNDERLKNPKQFGEDYFDELLERIRDIRASEKRFYQKICDIYKTSIDYSSNDEEAKLFFKTVQNKIHYGVHGHTAAELIMKRADATKDNMGLTAFEGAKVRKKDVDIAKNYLNEEEMSELNRVDAVDSVVGVFKGQPYSNPVNYRRDIGKVRSAVSYSQMSFVDSMFEQQELDAVDAYNQRLVKRIEVKGFQVKNFRGTDKYLYLESIIISPKHPPRARIEFEVKYDKSINREMRILGVDDNLYELSKNMEQYKGYRISEIDPIVGSVTFTNGEVIHKGDVVGDVSEKDMRRIQIRETIISHMEKEEELFNRGIKTLSLFFIDEVAKYRMYDEAGEELLGEYGQMFEEEYRDVVNNYITIFDTPYQRYLKAIEVEDTHKGYFSIDKKGHAVNSAIKRGSDFSDDISAYDLILKNKERLLSFSEPTRFIFSHSALREGWDNPNVFQICTLKHSDSTTMKRQEVGRGLRLCVNQDGFRMDEQSLGKELVHKVNKLTVVASESYKDFVTDLQRQIKDVLYDRPTKASKEYFVGKMIHVDGVPQKISDQQATAIYRYLLKNDYIDDNEHITEQYRADLENNALAPLAEELKTMTEGIHKLIQSIFNDKILEDMIGNGNETTVPSNDLNENFAKKEFQTLWNYINHKYAYTVDFDSNELIKKAIEHIDRELFVSQLQYTVSKSEQIVLST